MTKEQLHEYLDKRGIEYDGRWSEEKLMAIVAQYEETFAAKKKVALESSIPESPTASEQVKLGVPTFSKHHNTEESVREAIAKYLNVDGFMAKFTQDPETGANVWHFRCKGAEESGNMDIPLRVIVMKAESVARGARGLKAIKGDGTYKGYADTIFMA
jgi:hypothetical protein